MLIAQFSDMHVKTHGMLTFGQLDTAQLLEDCIHHVNRLTPLPDAVVITGDLANDGLLEEYLTLRDLLAQLQMPYYLIPGNHDDAANLRQVFGNTACLPGSEGSMQYVVELPPLRLVALNTVVSGRAGGRLSTENLSWLAARLAEAPDSPTVIFMHHPPFVTGIPHMDAIGLENAADLAEVVGRHAQVERVLCGHLHRPIHARWAGTVASTCPSTAHQVVLTLDGDSDLKWRREPAAIALHLYEPGIGLVSHLSYVGDFGTANAFSDDHTFTVRE